MSDVGHRAPRFVPLSPPQRLLMGPGPSMIQPRVLRALAAPTVGHVDPTFLAVMDELQALLREAFVTANALTFAVSGTGSAGMEAALANLLEPGDHAVVGVNGVFGGRMADIVERLGCSVTTVQAPFGQALDPDDVRRALRERPTKVLAVVHAETSTGVLQDVSALAAVAREAGALCVADCVTSLGGVPVRVDDWDLDAVYSGTQKCLSCPPGLSPITFSSRALATLRTRKTKVASWYLDANMLLQYWGSDRVYHHTAPVNMLYALREALVILLEEGLAAAHARHALHHRALCAGLTAMGLRMPVAPALRMPQLNVVTVPEGVDDAVLRRALLDEYGIEIGAGIGALKGKVLRIGLMGYTARRENVVTLLGALEQTLPRLGARIEHGAALAAAAAAWSTGAGA
jgi:alanine-glyoxylate transaminase/serine-glyoxylate transaminase/serine-pyruvate transaminase